MRGYLLIPASIAAAALYAACDAELGLGQWWQLRGELFASRQRIAEVEREVARLRRDAAELETQPFAVERAIREDLQLARPGETLVRLPSGGARRALPGAPDPPRETGRAERGAGP